MKKIMKINTKKLKTKSEIDFWVSNNKINSSLIDWYLNDSKSRAFLQDCADSLNDEYILSLDSNIRIMWNQINSLLNDTITDDKIKEDIFHTFLTIGNYPIKYIKFKKDNNEWKPISL